MGAAVVLGSAYLLFRTPRYTHTLDAADEARVRTLLRDFGGEDSLGYFATRRDKSVVWDSGDSSTARAGVSYRVVGSVSLASGNPRRRPAAVARGHRGVAAPGADQRLVARGHGRRQPGSRRVHGGGPQGLGDRRRGDPRPAVLLADRPGHEGRAAVGRTPAAPRLHHPGGTSLGARRGALRVARRGGGAVARGRRRRARLLDGPGPARRRPGRRLRADRGATTSRVACAGSSASSRGAATGCRWT